ncbi:MAG: hypothetical protein JSS27_07990 [Planctomycetes bacterium]|nr:hypothetical protein [Planctomycetota bacterium]
MKLLTICYPTFGRDNVLQLTSKGDRVLLAPDEFHVGLLELGWTIDVVSLAEPTPLTLFRSGLPLLRPEQIDWSKYDLIWHMLRDPTQPEALALLARLPQLPNVTVINHADRLKDHHKANYLPILHALGLAPRVTTLPPNRTGWLHSYGSFISPDRKWIDTNAFNNNRGDYPARGHGRIVTEFIDNQIDGWHSVVRFGFVCGVVTSGLRYWSTDAAFRSGGAMRHEAYSVPARIEQRLCEGLSRIGCDVCHVEAVPTADGLYVIDINPYPTADGKTLSTITRAMVEKIDRHFRRQ